MKAAELRATLGWLDTAVASLHEAALRHPAVLDRLETDLHRARAHLSDLDNLVGIGHPALVPHAFPILHTLELITNRVGVTYLPALQHQGPAERLVRGLVLCAARAAGLTWLVDVVVRLDGPHAAYVAYPELPILYAPPRQASSLVDLPGLYHELGHAVLEYDRTTSGGRIGVLLRSTVTQHFVELARRAGPMTPERRAARESRIAEAAAFWTEARLAEIFCDVLATVVCGPAHYLSFVDLAFRYGRSPFAALASHPPVAARVRACEQTLTLPHQREPVVERLRAAWTTHERQHQAFHGYDLACSKSLIDALVRASLAGISATLPECHRYAQPLAHAEEIGTRTASGTLEGFLNDSTVLLVEVPERYADWERGALPQCHRLTEMASGD